MSTSPENYHHTIIIGAGVSGLGCALKLRENHVDYRVISPDIGGRILPSTDGKVQYGAYYIMDNYVYTRRFLIKGRRIRPAQIRFHGPDVSYGVFDPRLAYHPIQFARLLIILKNFRDHYEELKRNMEWKEQVECLREDGYLWKLYHTPADEFVKEKGIQDVVYQYMAEVLHGSGFLPIRELNAFTFLHFSLPLIIPTFEFHFDKERIMLSLKDTWIRDRVTGLESDRDIHRVMTDSGTEYTCTKLVVATEPHIAAHLIHHDQPLRKPANVFMFHINGKIREEWADGCPNLFEEADSTLALAPQEDGTFLFYSLEEHPCLEKYFLSWEVIHHHHWAPAFQIGGSNLVDFKQGHNLYLIGDNNVCGLEDAYICGIYAANRIMGNTAG